MVECDQECGGSMNGMTAYLDGVSLLGASAWLGVALLVADLALTLFHSNEERKGHLWRYFGAIAGVLIVDWVGVSLFFISLTVVLWLVGFIGLTGHFPTGAVAPTALAMALIGALIGARVSDTFYSHIRLDRRGYRPNPGLSSTPYYLIEAAALIIIFYPGLTANLGYAIIGVIGGWAAFYAVLPGLHWLRRFDRLRREQWRPGEAMPSWARVKLAT